MCCPIPIHYNHSLYAQVEAKKYSYHASTGYIACQLNHRIFVRDDELYKLVKQCTMCDKFDRASGFHSSC